MKEKNWSPGHQKSRPVSEVPRIRVPIVVLAFFTSMLTAVGTLWVQAPAVLITYFLFGVVGLLMLVHRPSAERRIFSLVYCWAIMVTWVLYALYTQRYGVPYYVGGSDDWIYEVIAGNVARGLGAFQYSEIRGNFVPEYHNSVGYIYVVSLLYRLGDSLGGFHTLIPRFFNALLLSGLAVGVYRMGTTQVKLTTGTAYYVALFTGLAPIMMYNAAHTFRDTLVAFLMFWLIYAWNNIGNWSAAVCLSVPGLFFLWELRSFTAVATACLVGVAWWDSRARGYSRVIVTVLLLALFAGGITLFTATGHLQSLVGQLGLAQDNYSEYRAGLTDGLARLVFYAPPGMTHILRLAYLAITPVPVWSQDAERIWLGLGTLIQVLYLPFLGIGLWRLVRKMSHLHVLASFIALYTSVAWLTFTGRHISMYFAFGALVAGAGFDEYRGSNRSTLPVFGAMAGVLTFAAISYLVAKQ